MENATKALLIAGGMLLVMLVVGLILFAWGKFSEFYSSQDELLDTADLAKFNLQFTNYENRNVHGYELISLANKVADYNFRYSNATDARNDHKYSAITMRIHFPNEYKGSSKSVENQIWYNNEYNVHLFNDGATYTQSQSINQIVGQIVNAATGIESYYRDSSIASKLAKSISSLIVTREQVSYTARVNQITEVKAREILEKEALAAYNSIVKNSTQNSYNAMVQILFNTYNIRQYYEYYQFKKAIFTCTGITYDSVTDRVSTIDFEFTGKIE